MTIITSHHHNLLLHTFGRKKRPALASQSSSIHSCSISTNTTSEEAFFTADDDDECNFDKKVVELKNEILSKVDDECTRLLQTIKQQNRKKSSLTALSSSPLPPARHRLVVPPVSTTTSSLNRLLAACAQSDPFQFTAYFDSILARSDQVATKIGEASYSDVFQIGSLVYKIVPLASSSASSSAMSAEDALQELLVTRTLSGAASPSLCIPLVDAKVITGSYHPLLLECWDSFALACTSENDRPSPNQLLYVVLVLENGGPDLEHFQFESAKEIVQVALDLMTILADGESTLQFEHRDLHWGNVLVNRLPNKLKVSLIDFSYSRLVVPEGVLFYDFERDLSIFDGAGEYQFEVYRQMRKATGSQWNTFCPRTNVLWLVYLIGKLVEKLHGLSLTETRSSVLRKQNQLARLLKSVKKRCFDLYQSCVQAEREEKQNLLSILDSLVEKEVSVTRKC